MYIGFGSILADGSDMNPSVYFVGFTEPILKWGNYQVGIQHLNLMNQDVFDSQE